MATYRQVHISFWQDPYIEDLSAKEKYFYIYLMTNSKTKQCGCYEISMKLIKYETALTQQEIDAFITKLSIGNKIRYNPENQEFLILNWLKHNSFKSPKVLACIIKELQDIKTEEFKQYIYDFSNGNTSMDSLSIVYRESIDTQSQEEEEEEEIKKKKKQSSKDFIPPTLEEIKKYCLERKNSVDCKRFLDFFEASNWVDSKGNKVKNWKQKIITWESYNGNKSQETNVLKGATSSPNPSERVPEW